MDSDRTNRWLTLAANVGVVIGLILVAYEVRQTNVALDRDYDIFWADVNGRLREGWREFNGRIIESEEVASIWLRENPESDFGRLLLNSDLPFLDESTSKRDN